MARRLSCFFFMLALFTMMASSCLARQNGVWEASAREAQTLEAVVSAETAGNALAEAFRFVDATYRVGDEERRGVAYLWGGRMSVDSYLQAMAQGAVPGVDAGVDASGVVTKAYLSADPGLRFRGAGGRWYADATSRSLFEHGVRMVSVFELRPGDLIFFQGDDGQVTGVAIFEKMEGPNVHFIVASSRAGRVIRTFYNTQGEYWQKVFKAAGQLRVNR